MGNQPSMDFCPDLANSVSSTSAEVVLSVPYFFVLLAILTIPFVAAFPFYLDYILALSSDNTLGKFIKTTRRVILGYISLCDISSSRDDVQFIHKNEKGQFDLAKKSEIAEGEKAINISLELRAIGGYISILLGFIIAGIVFVMYATHESYLSESVVANPSPMPHFLQPIFMEGSITDIPCTDADIKVEVSQGSDLEHFMPLDSQTEHDGNFCNVKFIMELFGENINPSGYRLQFRLTNWRSLQKDGDEFRRTNVRLQGSSHMIDKNLIFPTGETAFVYMDSCRQAQFDPTKRRVTLSAGMSIRNKCNRLIGSAYSCVESNIALTKVHVQEDMEGADSVLLVRVPLGTVVLDSTITRRLDAELFVTLIVGILSLLILQPIVKRILLKFLLLIFQKLATGKSLGVLRSIGVAFAGSSLCMLISFVFFMFVTDVIFEFKKQTPSYIFSGSMWIFGRDAELVLSDLILFGILLIFNFIAEIFFLGIAIFFIVNHDMLLSMEKWISEEAAPFFGANLQPSFRSKTIGYGSQVEDDEEV